MSFIDLNRPPPNHTYSVSLEREETNSERNVRLFKDVALFAAALGFVTLIIVWICFVTLTAEHAPPEEKKWAMSLISAAAGSIIGYLICK